MKKGKKILLGVIAVIILLCIIGCNNTEIEPEYAQEHDSDATVSMDDIKVSNLALSDNKGDEVPMVVNSISYQETFTDFMNISYELENLTDTDYKEVKLAALAWDKDGFPLKLSSSEYTEYFIVDNVKAKTVQGYTHQIADFIEIGHMSLFVCEYTDFEDNTWENPIMESISELEGNRLSDTDISYFTFE